jgi:hypothetical protein
MSEHKGWAAGVSRHLDSLEKQGTSPFQIVTRTRADRWLSLLIAASILIAIALQFIIIRDNRLSRELTTDYFQMLAMRIQPASCPVPQGWMVPLPQDNRTVEQ